jgi:hypothetical protein
LYAPVGGAEQAFERFGTLLNGFAAGDRGHAVLVSGPQGSGKSTLIHRCVDATRTPLATAGGTSARVIDLSEQSYLGSGSADQALSLLQSLVDRIELEEDLLSKDDVARVQERADNVARAASMLGGLLRAAGTTVVVVLPAIETEAQLSSNLGLLRQNLVFFLETAFAEVEKYCVQQYGQAASLPVPVLNLRNLDPTDDGWEFVRMRVAAAQNGGGANFPEITEATVREFMAARTDGGLEITVGELQRTCHDVYERAIAQQQNQISFEDFGRHYIATRHG